MRDDLIYWVALSLVHGIGPKRYRKLINKFGNPKDVFEADVLELQSVVNLKVINEIKRFQVNFAEDVLEKIHRIGAQIATFIDKEYPEALREFDDAPTIIFYKGRLADLKRDAIAIVGTRTPTYYGESQARRFARELAGAGFTIVSGGARGIDTQAHLGALDANGFTVAVMGCGIDLTYPPENQKLFDKIAENGVVLTEYPPGTRPVPENFPKRNRIISGLSLGVFVVEAGAKSGALITARWAALQGKEVFALPGPINSSKSEGTNKLIQEGAKLVQNVEDILEEFGRITPREREARFSALDEDEKKIYLALLEGPRHIDELAVELDMPANQLLTKLFVMEMKGIITELPGKYFACRT